MAPIVQIRLGRVGDTDLVETTLATHEFPRHTHDAFTVALVDEGCFQFTANGATHTCPRGSFVLINPGEVHTGRAIKEAGTARYRTASPSEADLRRLLGESPPLETGAARAPGLARRFAALFTLGDATDEVSTLRDLWAELFGRFRAAPARGGDSRRDGLVTAMIAHFRDHLAESDVLGSAARRLGYHPGYLSRVFRAHTGLPPHGFLLQLRTERARQLLAGAGRVAEVAIATGFVDQSHLTRHFRAFFGVPPRRYQRRLGVRFLQEPEAGPA